MKGHIKKLLAMGVATAMLFTGMPVTSLAEESTATEETVEEETEEEDLDEAEPEDAEDEESEETEDSDTAEDTEESDAEEETSEDSDDAEDTDESEDEETEDTEDSEDADTEEEDCAHTYVYTSNEDGTHTVTCEKCDYEEIVDCTYVDGKCKYCEYEKPEGTEDEDDAEAFSYEETVAGYTISISAEEGVLPAGTTVTISKVSYTEEQSVQELVEEELDETETVEQTVTFDITFYDEDGTEIEPEDGCVSVNITLAQSLLNTASEDHTIGIRVYHIDDEDTVEEVESSQEGSELTFEAEEFSAYAVTVVKEAKQSMDGGIHYNELYVDMYGQETMEDVVDAQARELEEEEASGASAAGSSSNTYTTCSSKSAAASYIKTQMVARASKIYICMSSSYWDYVDDIIEQAMEYSDSCSGQEGDALLWGYTGYEYQVDYYDSDSNYDYAITMYYYTNASQEKAFTKKVSSIMSSLDTETGSQYDTIRAIYDYVCDNVDYDYTNLEKYERGNYSDSVMLTFTGYAAACNGTSVCQGYAIFFYRLAKEYGLSCRIITSSDHAWNIVKIGSYYYNVDSTWDGEDSVTYHNYFLKCNADFPDHTRESQYNTSAFNKAYPMSSTSYDLEAAETYYTVTFNGNGVTLSEESRQVKYGNTLGTMPTGTKKGYAISSWNTKSDGSGSAVTTSTKIKKNLTIYAQWTPITYKIAFDGNGSTSGSTATMTDCTYNQEITLIANGYKKKGYKFVSWNTAADGTGTEYANQAVVKNLQYKQGKTKTLYAQWKKAKYTITYELNSGTNSDSNPSYYYVTTSTITLADPTRKGYTFKGWFTDSDYTNQITQIAKGSTGNKTLYAKWSTNKYYIKFYGNNSTSGSMDTMTCKYTTSYTLTSNAFKRTGYSFNGWNTAADGTGTAYANGATVKKLSSKSGGTVKRKRLTSSTLSITSQNPHTRGRR